MIATRKLKQRHTLAPACNHINASTLLGQSLTLAQVHGSAFDVGLRQIDTAQVEQIHRQEVLEGQLMRDIQHLVKVLQQWGKASEAFMGYLAQWKISFHTAGRFVHPDEVKAAFLRALHAGGISIDQYSEEGLN